MKSKGSTASVLTSRASLPAPLNGNKARQFAGVLLGWRFKPDGKPAIQRSAAEPQPKSSSSSVSSSSSSTASRGRGRGGERGRLNLRGLRRLREILID